MNQDQVKRIAMLTEELLLCIGEDPQRLGLEDTPRRVASFWKEFIDYDPGNTDTTFESVSTDQMVIVSGIRVWSLCEHHLMPFWCDVSIGYLTHDTVLGLSKFARIAHLCAHRLQLQERLVQQIADGICSLVKHDDVAVLATGEHLCMTARGIKTRGLMTSSVMRGAFLASDATRREFLSLARQRLELL